jgi:hypothetical protein
MNYSAPSGSGSTPRRSAFRTGADAGRRDCDRRRSPNSATSAALLACVEAIGVPAYVLDRGWTARCWNIARHGGTDPYTGLA